MQYSLFIAKTFRKLKFIQGGYLKGINFHLYKKINNSQFRIPVTNNIGWNNIFEYEPWMSQVLKKILHDKGDLFIDVGANIGQTLLTLRSISRDVPYIGFEVNSACLFYLNKLIEANHFRNTDIIPVGLSNKTCLTSLNFFTKNSDDATASIIENLRPGSIIEKTEFVYHTSLDEIIKKLPGKISILKIDVEGAEPEVLSGAVNTIREHRPYIIMEILPAYSSENTWRVERQQIIEKYIESSDYRIIQINKDSNNNLAGFLPLKNLGISTNIMERDFLFVPNELEFKI